MLPRLLLLPKIALPWLEQKVVAALNFQATHSIGVLFFQMS